MDKATYYRYLKKGKTCGVFLHGWGGDSKAWQFMERPMLDSGYSFLSIDLPGHGLSVRPTKFITMKDYAKDVVDILSKERINQVVLIGHCFGGMVAQEIAIRYPRKVKELILVNTDYKMPAWINYGDLIFPLFKIIRTKPKYIHRDFTKYRGSVDIDLRRLLDDISHAGTYSYFIIYQGLKNWNRETAIKTVYLPALIIGGEHDIIFPIKRQKQLAKNLPRAKLVFLNTNHLAPVNAPEELKNQILQRLSQE